MARRTIAQWLDASVDWTGIPKLVEQTPRRKPHRWWPLLSIAVTASGCGLFAATNQRWAFGFAMALVIFGLVTSLPLEAHGPYRPFNAFDVDEFDRRLRGETMPLANFALRNGTVLLLGGTALIGVVDDWPAEKFSLALVLMVFVLLTLWTAIPNLIASWKMGKPLDDRE